MSRPAILVYDRSAHTAAMLCQILEDIGYRSRAAFLDTEVKRAVEELKPSAVLASYDLFPLPRELATIPAAALAPLGNFAEVGEVQSRYGVSALTHPYREEDVASRLKQLLSARPAEPAVEKEEEEKDDIIGASPAVREMKRIIHMAAPTDSTVLILGETGSGKELTARALHRLSRRADGPFLAVNCGALAEGVLESELFGHRRGAFTGAVKERKGLLEAAHGGTLLLDEVGDMPPQLQVKLLRVLESGRFIPVGAEKEQKVDIRFVCATNRDIFRMTEDGLFRRDLLYRINVIALQVPPLRERQEDMELLAGMFLKRYADKYGKEVERFSPRATEQMKEYHWPGNIRELEHTVERAVVEADGPAVEKLSFAGEAIARADTGPDMQKLLELDFAGMKDVVLEHYEKEYLDALLEAEEGRLQRAAKRAGMDRKTLYRKMTRYGLDKKDYR